MAEPVPGLVIRYSYLWRSEAKAGQEEGLKDRPCAVIIAMKDDGERTRVYVAPVTHTLPQDPRHAIEIPAETKRRLGLDDQRSWIVTTDLNAFTWPGPDVRPVIRSGALRHFFYGHLPNNMTRDLVANIRERAREGQAQAVNWDEP